MMLVMLVMLVRVTMGMIVLMLAHLISSRSDQRWAHFTHACKQSPFEAPLYLSLFRKASDFRQSQQTHYNPTVTTPSLHDQVASAQSSWGLW
jgi:hypothetical protein